MVGVLVATTSPLWLLLLALIYMILTGILVAVFRYFENKIPVKM